MTRDMHDADRDQNRSPETIENALRAIGRRPQPSEHGTRVAYSRAHARWQEVVQQRARRRLWRGIGLLAASFAFAAIGVLLWSSVRLPESVAVVAATYGDSNQYPLRDPAAALHEDDVVRVGTIIETASDARLALTLSTGHSLRLDYGTRLTFLEPGRFSLEYGRVYVDSGPTRSAQPVRIVTPIASLTDVGTQFQATWKNEALRVQVREGSVMLRTLSDDGMVADVSAGDVVAMERSQEIVRSSGSSFGPEWAWVAAASPGLDASVRGLDQVLNWVCRELGYTLRYADARTQRAAEKVVLDGSMEGLTPEQTLEVLQNITSFRYRREAGELTLESIDAQQ